MNQELSRQKVKANLPAIQQHIRQLGLKKLEANDHYSGKYEQLSDLRVLEWEEGMPLLPPDKKAEFYYLQEYDTFAYVYFYRKAKHRKKVESAPPEQTEEQKRIQRAWDMLKEASALAFQLRSRFISGFSPNSDNLMRVYEGAVKALVLDVCCYHSGSREDMLKLLNLSSNTDASAGRVLDAYKTNPHSRALLHRLVYAAFGDSKNKHYAAFFNPSSFPQYNTNPELDALYDWLISLGYEMSDEEQALRDGTHAVFHAAQDKQEEQAAQSGKV